MLTLAGIKMLGFEPFEDGQVISAEFHLFRVFEVRGITSPDGEHSPPMIHKHGGCRFALGRSVNELCQVLLGDVFVDNEEAWKEERKALGPFLAIHFGPTPQATVNSGFLQKKDGSIVTYDCFAAQKEMLRQVDEGPLAALVAALEIALADGRHPIQLVPQAREVIGRTPDGSALVDVRITSSARAYVSSPLAQADWNQRVVRAISVEQQVPHTAGRFYHQALFETDPLKRFLFFFLFLERYTHWHFGEIATRDLALAAFAPERLGEHANRLLSEPIAAAKSLRSRFLWCVLVRWPALGAAEINDFLALKRERDRLSHGERNDVPESLATSAHRLCLSVVLAATGS
jgi:hypothetical protein